MLLANEQIVKRTKATVLPMPNEVVLHLNSLAANRKVANVKQPVYENSHTVFDDDDDVDDDPEYIGDIEYDTVKLNTRCHLLAFVAKVEKQLQATVSIQ